ncbi:MAG TPA: tRNA (guanosine(37)-N1)-methyltransferase TrmD [Thermoanaerobaculia bacterium]
MNFDDLIALGIIRKPHGIRGEASIEPWTDSPERFDELRNVILVAPDRDDSREATIESMRIHGERVLIHFAGIESPEELHSLRNWTIEIPSAEAKQLEEGEYFLHDLPGIELFDESGRKIGTIEDAASGGGGTLFTIRRSEGGGSFDAPFAEEFFREIDIAGKRMVVSFPPGIEDLDSAEEARDGEEAPRKKSRERREIASLRVDVVTIFPRMFGPILSEGVLARAIEENILQINIWDLRNFSTDQHRSTDDEAYGGGAGMVMLAEPFFRSVDAIRGERPEEQPHILLMSPQGRTLDQTVARELGARPWLVILCGRYEGLDERVREALVDEEISLGDFVVSGGETPAMLLIDAVSRMVEGVVGERNSVEADSFYHGLLDYPHYTRPAELRGMRVPDVLLSGHAENIRKWRKEESLRATMAKRPDLLESVELDDEGRAMLEQIRRERSS